MGGGVEFMNWGDGKPMLKNLCPNFLKPLLENGGRRGCSDGSLDRIPIFHTPQRKNLPSPPAVTRTLMYLAGVLSKASTHMPAAREAVDAA